MYGDGLCGSKLGEESEEGSRAGVHLRCGSENDPPAEVLGDFNMRSTKVSKNRSIWGSRGARLGVQSIVFGVPYGLRKWTHLGPYKIVAYLGSGPRNSDFTV